MLKDLKKVQNLYKSLRKKQVLDMIAVFIAFVACYIIAKQEFLTNLITTISVVLIFTVVIIFLEETKKNFNNKLKETFGEISDETIHGVKNIEIVVDNQKSNINALTLKVVNIKNVLKHSQEHIKTINSIIDTMHGKSRKSLDFTNEENISVKANIDKMFKLRHKIQIVAELILELSEFAQTISSTVNIVEDMAEQTNLLALNATVEAARAGEHGKGFAVVAGEIRKLADESKQATSKISSLVTDIQHTTNSTVMATEEGTKEIESGISLANTIAENFEQLFGSINEITKEVEQLAEFWEYIEQDTKNIDGFTEELENILTQGREITEDHYKYTADLNEMADNFKPLNKDN